MPPRHCEEPKATKQSKDISKSIFNSDGSVETAKNINAYLLDGENIFVGSRSKPLCKVPEIAYGSFALDDGNYTIEEEEFILLKQQDKSIEKFLKPFIGAAEMLNRKKRWCVWLLGKSPSEIKENTIIYNKVKKVKAWRLASNRKNTQQLANTPTLFAENRQPECDYLAIPTVCSGKREYVPIVKLSKDVIASNQIYVIPDANLFDLGILSSSVHMAWIRTVCGRIKSDYRYSSKIVYNNFPWPVDCFADARNDVKENARNDVGKNARNDVGKNARNDVEENVRNDVEEKIEKTAQAILDARALYPDCSLADLYDETTMPIELRKAHQANDAAVMAAYGFNKNMTESEIVAELLKMYQQLVSGETRR